MNRVSGPYLATESIFNPYPFYKFFSHSKILSFNILR
uniref:Uncharacterized protein n=1 Tax=Rhizophora mucronata TaxID=61149 RepID=A0A2P2QLA5_RHIMU